MKFEKQEWINTFYLDGIELTQYRGTKDLQQSIREICIDYGAKLVRDIDVNLKLEKRYIFARKRE